MTGTYFFRILETNFAALLSGCLILFFSFRASAQPPQFRMQEYIDKYSKEAVHQMVHFKIPASVILAQAIFESRSGTSRLARNTNNHFGIKCHAEWNGDSFQYDDDTLNECFRKYARIEDSYLDHSLFLVNRSRYSELFQLEITDYKAWCYGLKRLGYATYPTYAEELIKIIEQTQLYELDHSEKLNNSIAARIQAGEIIPSKYAPTGFTINAFSKNQLLWLDERDVLIQSLDMIIDRPTVYDMAVTDNDLLPSRFNAADFNMRTFSDAGLLWVDEKDVLIQSLDLMIERADENWNLAGM